MKSITLAILALLVLAGCVHNPRHRGGSGYQNRSTPTNIFTAPRVGGRR